jgi:hypothetical protein
LLSGLSSDEPTPSFFINPGAAFCLSLRNSLKKQHIDDRQDFIDGAKQAEFQTILFKNTEKSKNTQPDSSRISYNVV